jgi:hypothetical protein
MSQNTNDTVKTETMTLIETINTVKGFAPDSLALVIGNMNDGSKRKHLPVMAQMAWFRLKYPEGRLAVSVKPGRDSNGNTYFIADARVYAHYSTHVDSFLAEGSAARGTIPDKPTVSPREWAQTAAIGMALRNAGFGLQFAVAGESYEDNTLNELGGMNVQEMPDTEDTTAPANLPLEPTPAQPAAIIPAVPPEPELSLYDKAVVMLCPIAKYKDKTLGEMVRIDPKALVYVSNNGTKYGAEVAESARIICEAALAETA